jgi:hypothetical protein
MPTRVLVQLDGQMVEQLHVEMAKHHCDRRCDRGVEGVMTSLKNDGRDKARHRSNLNFPRLSHSHGRSAFSFASNTSIDLPFSS